MDEAISGADGSRVMEVALGENPGVSMNVSVRRAPKGQASCFDFTGS
jgi:hypothetical protein